MTISKFCADHLRDHYRVSYNGKLKASHAHELVAAFFGYKSNAALLAEKRYPLANLGEASFLVPDVPMIEQRRLSLSDLPADLPSSLEIAETLSSAIKTGGYFDGEVWLYSSLGEYITETFLHEQDGLIQDELSGVMAETNAYFDESYYESADVSAGEDEVAIEVSGKYYGENDPDRMYWGDTIDLQVTVTLYRCAGRAAFRDWELSAQGAVNHDDVDPEVRSGVAV